MDKQGFYNFGDKIIQNENSAKEFLHIMIKDSIAELLENEKNTEFFDEAITTSLAFGDISLNFINSYSESPIEKLFLYSLLITSFKYQFLGIVVVPPQIKPIEYIKNSTEHYKELIECYNLFKTKTNGNLHVFEKLLQDYVKSENGNNITEKQKREINVDVVMYLGFDFYNKIHIMLQPTFQKILNGKNIRGDMLIWIPPYENIKILIECDGYEFHNSKEAFINDRKRDRVLKNNGIEVLRFSGSEIKTNFIEIFYEIMNLLMKKLNYEKSVKTKNSV
ncbi:MAG: DUF559 domain-containing protein [Spirochaetaceae bacterium]|jgi:hypothetical protein|nr:DUF559 domain-containing protein [Spirochaetaceae bacterium]